MATARTKEKACRNAVWLRDGRRSRASGQLLERVHRDPNRRGEVAHLENRSTNPAEKFNPDVCVLLSAEEHRLSDPRTAGAAGMRLLLIEPELPDGPLCGRARLTFIRINRDGHELWRRTS